MSNYTKATNFASKDTLPVGDANKKVKGSEIDTEFNAISDAIATKANKDSPTFTGTPTVPAPSAGDDSTQIATTAFVQDQKESPAFTGTPTAPTAAVGTDTTQIATTAFVLANSTSIATAYPVGSIYMNATNSTNPATLLGFGTWVAFGAGRVLVGLDSGDADFNAAEETGGTKTKTVSITTSNHTHSTPDHTHGITTTSYGLRSGSPSDSGYTVVNGVTNTTTTSDGGSTTGSAGGETVTDDISIVQPYITVYMWKRTA